MNKLTEEEKSDENEDDDNYDHEFRDKIRLNCKELIRDIANLLGKQNVVQLLKDSILSIFQNQVNLN